MNLLLVSDLHLTDRPRDEYRWGLFDQLWSVLRKQRVNCGVVIAGDLTDAKDFHSARLVNRVVESIARLRVYERTPIFILRGNHDGTDPECPYFKFLNGMPGVRYIHKPRTLVIGNRVVLFLPHTRNPEADWAALQGANKDADLAVIHATVHGAVSETGVQLDGVHQRHLRTVVPSKAPIFAGDVHVPQTVGRVTYIGAPYHVRFGDTFKPRAILLTDRGSEDVQLNSLRRVVADVHDADELAALRLRPGDQLKVRLHLTRAEYVDYQARKARVLAFCEQRKVELCNIALAPIVERFQPIPARQKARKPASEAPRTPLATFTEYCTATGLVDPRVVEAGREILAMGDNA